MTRTYAGLSDSQANAEALARRSAPYTAAHETSVRVSWDWHRREPSDLREAVRIARKAYSDEVPDKLHDGPDAIGDDGTPRMTARAVGYVFGDPEADDAAKDPETGQRDLAGWRFTPFRSALSVLARGSAHEQRRAAIVAHITIGGQEAVASAIAEGAHPFDAKLVAFDALASFLRSMTDLKLHPRPEAETAA